MQAHAPVQVRACDTPGRADLAQESASSHAVALSHALISRLAENSGLKISHMTPGKWDGSTESQYLHDMYVFTKA